MSRKYNKKSIDYGQRMTDFFKKNRGLLDWKCDFLGYKSSRAKSSTSSFLNILIMLLFV